MLQRLPTEVAQLKSGNTCKNLLNEIRNFTCYLFRQKEVTKKVCNNIINSISL